MEQNLSDFARNVLDQAMTKVQQKFKPGTPVSASPPITSTHFRRSYTIETADMNVDIEVSTKTAGLNIIANRSGSAFIPRGCNFFYDYDQLPGVTVDSFKAAIEDAIFTVIETMR